MSDKSRQALARNLLAQVIEDLGADAAVLVFTRCVNNETTTHTFSLGNIFACSGMIDTAAEDLFNEDCNEVFINENDDESDDEEDDD